MSFGSRRDIAGGVQQINHVVSIRAFLRLSFSTVHMKGVRLYV